MGIPVGSVCESAPGERVLDVACGTGVIARHVAPLVGSNGWVCGLDLNPNMLAIARAAAEREGLVIEWYEGQAEKLPFPDGSFDLVMCQFALMFFADRVDRRLVVARTVEHSFIADLWDGS